MHAFDKQKFMDSKFRIYAVGNYTVQGITLGKGNFAKVKLATHKIIGAATALKIINLNDVKEPYVIRNLEREVKILARLNHPNIVKFYEAIWCNKLYCISMEYIRGGDLAAHIKAHHRGRLIEMEAKHLFRQILSAVGHMHRHGILHRDLKLENIMMDNPSMIKIVDFGLSNFYRENQILQTRCGSPEYAAPELFIPNIKYGPAVDMWSLGIILYVMVIGSVPFVYLKQDSATIRGRRQHVYKRSSKGLVEVHRRAMETLTKGCRDLLHGLIQPNQILRYKLETAEQHSWLFVDAGRPFEVQQPNPSLYHKFHSIVMQKISTLTSTPAREIERQVKYAPYGKMYAMYHLLLDLMVKNGQYASTLSASGESVKFWNPYLPPYIPYYHPTFRPQHKMQDKNEHCSRPGSLKQEISRLENSKPEFSDPSKSPSKSQGTSKPLKSKLSKREGAKTLSGVQAQSVKQKESIELLKFPLMDPMFRMEKSSKLSIEFEKTLESLQTKELKNIMIEKPRDGNGNSTQSILCGKENVCENSKGTNITDNDKPEDQNIKLKLPSSVHKSAGDGVSSLQKSEFQEAKNVKASENQIPYSIDKREKPCIRKRNAALENLLECKPTNDRSRAASVKPPAVRLTTTSRLQNRDFSNVLKGDSNSERRLPATAIGDRGSRVIKATTENTLIRPKTSHIIAKTKEKYVVKDVKEQPTVIILKRPAQPTVTPPTNSKGADGVKSFASPLFPIPSNLTSNPMRNSLLQKPITGIPPVTKLHENANVQSQTDNVSYTKQHSVNKEQNQSKYKPSPLCNYKHNNKIIDQSLGKRHHLKSTPDTREGFPDFCKDGFLCGGISNSRYSKQPVLPPLFKIETPKTEFAQSTFTSKKEFAQGTFTPKKDFMQSSFVPKKELMQNIFEPSKHRHESGEMEKINSLRKSFLSSGDYVGRTPRMRSIAPSRRPHISLYDKTNGYNHAKSQDTSRKIQFCSPSVVERTTQLTKPTYTTITESAHKFSDSKNIPFFTRNSQLNSNQRPLGTNTNNFQLNKPIAERNSKCEPLELRNLVKSMPFRSITKTNPIWKEVQKSPTTSRRMLNSSISREAPVRRDFNLRNVISKIDTGLTGIKTTPKRYSEIRAEYRQKKTESEIH